MLEFCVLRDIFMASGQGYLGKILAIFRKFKILFQSEIALTVFYIFWKFCNFVSLVKGDFNKLAFFIFEKVNLGLTPATKSCLKKSKKCNQG